MRLVFFNWAAETHGSAQDLYNYTHVARALGHEVVLYGPYGTPNSASPFTYAKDIGFADAVIFIFEFTTDADALDLVRLVSKVPRRRRVVIDCDGGYNDPISLVGDVNHPDEAASRRWVEVCDSLSDKVYQPTYQPLRPNVGTFFFHAYNPAWEQPLDFRAKEYGMVYVGNNWFRWRAMERLLRALEPIRERVGRIGLVGHGWEPSDSWGDPTLIEDAFYTDPQYLRQLGIEVRPPVRFDQVVAWMGKGVFTPVIYRPLFDYLRLVTCRTFETPAANVIPLFTQDADWVREIYGDEAIELVVPDEQPQEKILDLVSRPERYEDIVRGMRRHLAEKYSYGAQLRELIAIVES
jgi:glycosyltransferase involved in cell wall biosynthesis